MGAGGRAYAEWEVEEADGDCSIMLGVTALERPPPAGQYLYDSPESRMYYCCNSAAYPGGRRAAF